MPTFPPKVSHLKKLISGNLDDVRKLKIIIGLLEEKGLSAKVPDSKKIINTIKKIIKKHERSLEQERIEQLREHYEIRQKQLMQRIKIQEELDKELHRLIEGLEKFFKKYNAELQEIKDRAEKILELLKKLDAVRAELRDIRKNLLIKREQLGEVRKEFGELAPQIPDAKIRLKEKAKGFIRSAGLSFTDQEEEELATNYADNTEHLPEDASGKTADEILFDSLSKRIEDKLQGIQQTREEVAAIEARKAALREKLQELSNDPDAILLNRVGLLTKKEAEVLQEIRELEVAEREKQEQERELLAELRTLKPRLMEMQDLDPNQSPDLGPDSEPDSGPDPDPDPDSELNSGPDPDSEPDSSPDPDPDSDLDPNPDSEPDSGPDPDPDPDLDPTPENSSGLHPK